MSSRKMQRANVARPSTEPVVDADTMRLSNLQLEYLDLVGIQVTSAGRASLAAAARARGLE